MSRRVEALLEAARQVEVAEPPPLAAIRAETGVRARRSAYLAAFALALPLGAAAAAGGWAIKQRVDNAPHAAPKQVRPSADVPRAFAPAQQAPAMDEARPAAPGPAETSAGSSSMAKAESADAPSAAWPARVAGGSSAEPGRMAKAAVADAPSEARPARATPQADDSLREAPRREASRTPGVVAADGRQVPSATAEQRAVQPSTSHAIAPTPGAAQVDAPPGNAAPPDRPDRTFGVLSSPSELKQPKVPETPAAGGAPASTALSQEAAALTAMLATL
ncbi:MAG TPA: hypothetical protein VFK87_11915, partial [Steroidobacteraceae bacterium]|nr:hypothetical protein [Steroidobacteraceae bacterium]